MIRTSLNQLAETCHTANRRWWYRADGSRIARNKGELLMLVTTEIAEAMEGERKGAMDDKLPHRRMAEVELADAIIRILDYAAAYGYDLDGAFREKMDFNARREDHKQETSELALTNRLECCARNLDEERKVLEITDPRCADCNGLMLLWQGHNSPDGPSLRCIKCGGSNQRQNVLPEAQHPLPQKKEQRIVPQVCINPECDSQEAYITPSGHTCIKCGAGY